MVVWFGWWFDCLVGWLVDELISVDKLVMPQISILIYFPTTSHHHQILHEPLNNLNDERMIIN